MVRIIDELLNKTLINVEVKDKKYIIFHCNDGKKYVMEHEQDCCEDVWIEDIEGNIDKLLNSQILVAEEVSESGTTDDGTCTWTFYKFATVKGYVTIRWCGESNGHYSESVSIYELD